jgi:hypothetical protein
MLQLLNPLWLWAIAGIIIPVMIHLWHIKTGKTLKVGSIALLGESARQSSRSFRITDWPLLLLRCLLLLLLAFLLTEPLWQKRAQPTKTKGWVLIEKEPIKEVYARFKPQVDSLLKTGYELHEFDASFKAIKLEEILKDTSRKVNNNQNKPRSYWSLLKLVEQQLPQKVSVYLFTSNQLQHFKGLRPNVSVDLHWKTYTPTDSVSTWIQNAFLTSKDSIRLLIGNSKASGTSFSTINLLSADRGNSRFNVSFAEGKPIVALKNSSQPAVPVDTSTLKITIFQNQFPADAAYLDAALQAVKKFTHRKMKISNASSFNQIPVLQNWVFWLSDQNLPKNFSQKLVKDGNFFKYETGKSQSVNSWISSVDNGENSSKTMNLYQHFLADKRSMADVNVQTIWQDGFGQPVLSLQETENVNQYRFYSHFNPAWNDMTWSSDFPKMVLNLILKNYPQKDFLLNDKRIISSNQYQTLKTDNENALLNNPKTVDLTDLKHACWIALFLVFLLERILSFRTKKEEIYA